LHTPQDAPGARGAASPSKIVGTVLKVTGAFGLVHALSNASTAIATPIWQNVAMTGTSLIMLGGIAMAWRTYRRGEPALALERLYLGCFIAVGAALPLTYGAHTLIAVGLALLVLSTAPIVLPAAKIDRWAQTTIAYGLLCSVFDVIRLPTQQFVAGNPNFEPLVLVALGFFAVLIARNFGRFPVKTKLTLAILGTAILPLVVESYVRPPPPGASETNGHLLILAVAAGASLLSFALGHLLSGPPSSVAGSFTRGDVDARATVRVADEIGEGAARSNALAEDLERRPAAPPASQGPGLHGFVPPARFRVLRQLGAGGMGVVYEALLVETGERVALKTVLQTDAESILRIKREFRVISALHHPNLVRLGELFQAGEHVCFSMELVNGVDVRAYCRGDNEAPGSALLEGVAPRIRASFAQLARGIVALHHAGIVHCDIKPSNVLVTPNNRVVLLDFGLARGGALAHSSWTESMIAGTAHYMAPEQAAGAQVDKAADWYSAGVILHELLTGTLPFRGTPLRVMQDKQIYDPSPPRTLAPGAPADLDALCVALLRRDPGDRPSGEEVLAQLGAATAVDESWSGPPGAATTSDDGSGSSVFVGRTTELAVLRAALDDAIGGQAITVLVSGESGVGKTALVRHFLAKCKAVRDDGAGPLVLHGRCYERDAVPFNAVDPLVDALSLRIARLNTVDAALLLPRDIALLARIFPVLAHIPAVARATGVDVVDVQELRLRASRALRDLLDRIRGTRPVILAIDDLQWADADSVAMLSEVLHPPGAPALLLVATAQSDVPGTNPAFATLLDVVPNLRTIDLTGLPPVEARVLAERTLVAAQRSDPESVEGIVREAAGHPVFIHELALHAGVRWGTPGAVPQLHEAVAHRVAAQDPTQRRLLELLAATAGPVPQTIAARAVGIPADALGAVVATLQAARLISARGQSDGRIDMYHGRVREAVRASLDPDARRALLRSLVEAIDAGPAGLVEPEAHVGYLVGAGEPGRAALLSVEAARHAASALAFERAAHLYGEAIRLGAHSVDEVRELHTARADALVAAGRCHDAALAYMAAASGAPAALAISLHQRALGEFIRGGYMDEGLAVLHTVLRELHVQPSLMGRLLVAQVIWLRVRLGLRGFRHRRRPQDEIPEATLRLQDLWFSLSVGFLLATPVPAQYFHTRCMLLALATGEPFRIARSLFVECAFQNVGGTRRPKGARRPWNLARHLAADVTDPQQVAWLAGYVDITEGFAALCVGEWSRAVKLVDQGETRMRARCTGIAWELTSMQTISLGALAKLGDFVEVRLRHVRLRREARAQGNLFAETNLRTHTAPMLALLDDAPEVTRRDVLEAIGRWSKNLYHLQTYYAFTSLVEIDLYTGDFAAAHQRCEDEWPRLERSFLLRRQTTHIEVLDLRARAALAHAAPAGPPPLLRLARRCAAAIEREETLWGAPLASLIRAGVARLGGDLGRCVALLRAAVSGFERAEMKLHAAAAREALGSMLPGGEGAALRSSARAVFAEQGAKRVDRMMRLLAPPFATSAVGSSLSQQG